MLALWKKRYDKPKQHFEKQRHHFANKGPYSQSYGFSSSHVPVWELDHKKSWVPKNWSFWTVVLKKTLESSLDSKEIKSVNPKGNQPWLFIGRTDAEAEAPILWSPDAKNRLTGKDPDAGKYSEQEEKRLKEDEMVGWHQWTWIWANSRRSWMTGKPDVLQFLGSQRVQTWLSNLRNSCFTNCVSFCSTAAKWISYMHTCILSSSDFLLI